MMKMSAKHPSIVKTISKLTINLKNIFIPVTAVNVILDGVFSMQLSGKYYSSDIFCDVSILFVHVHIGTYIYGLCIHLYHKYYALPKIIGLYRLYH